MWLTFEDDETGTLQVYSRPTGDRFQVRLVSGGKVLKVLTSSASSGAILMLRAERRALLAQQRNGGPPG